MSGVAPDENHQDGFEALLDSTHEGEGRGFEREQAGLRRHESLRPAAAASTLLVMALMLGACADSDSSALPRGDGTTTAVPSSSEPATESTDSPSPTESDWESGFTPDRPRRIRRCTRTLGGATNENLNGCGPTRVRARTTLAFFASYFYNEQLVAGAPGAIRGS